MGKKKRQDGTVQAVEVQELYALLEQARTGPLGAEGVEKLRAAMSTLAFLQAELQAKGVSIGRLRRMLFGAPTEKTSRVLKDKKGGAAKAPHAPSPGYGRNPAAAYTVSFRQACVDRRRVSWYLGGSTPLDPHRVRPLCQRKASATR